MTFRGLQSKPFISRTSSGGRPGGLGLGPVQPWKLPKTRAPQPLGKTWFNALLSYWIDLEADLSSQRRRKERTETSWNLARTKAESLSDPCRERRCPEMTLIEDLGTAEKSMGCSREQESLECSHCHPIPGHLTFPEGWRWAEVWLRCQYMGGVQNQAWWL